MAWIKDPLMQRRWQRFTSIKRGYYSFLLLIVLLLLSAFLELVVNNRALMVRYQGQTYFPTYGAVIPGSTFGLDYSYETNYRDLKKALAESGEGFVVLPVVPWGPLETDLRDGVYPPVAPSLIERHFLGTDTAGRDILARLLYGFRIAILFSVALLVLTYLIGIFIGSLMGYFGGNFDLAVQRLIEIWVNIPQLYIIIIISSIVQPDLIILLSIMVLLGWTGIVGYVRSATFKEKAREYVMASESMGAGTFTVIYRHILPNILSVIITFVPFSVSSGIVLLTSLDFLGFGLPAPTPSWGELLQQGIANVQEAQWIVVSVVVAMVVVLSMITFIGEAVREAFDPKMFTFYR